MPCSIQRWFIVLSLLSLVACAEPDPWTPRVQALGSPSLVIGTVYAGGGNTGATFDHDFVVVVNRGASSVSADLFSLQYASASGTAALGATDATRTPLPPVLVPPGGALLVVMDAGGTTGAVTGVGDVPDATPLSLSTSGGRLALVRGSESLGCNGVSLPCDAAALGRLVDLVGWGAASWYETHPAPALTNASALVRLAGGCVDVDDGLEDFVVDKPALRSLVDAPRPCSVGAGDAGAPGLDASIDAAMDSGAVPDATLDAGLDANLDATLDAGLADSGASLPSARSASEIQGDTHRSRRVGEVVVGLEGIVTFVDGERFALQSTADSDERTSDAVFVTTDDDAPVGPGLRVRVDGVVRELRPPCGACSSASDGLSVTTVVATGIWVLGVANVPAPVDVGGGFLPLSLGRYTTPVDLDAANALSPDDSRLDRLESLEGMLVRLESPQVVGPTETRSDGLRELVVTDAATARPSASGRIESLEDGLRLVLLESGALPLPFLDVGDRFVGAVEGIVDYDRGRYVVRVIAHAGARRTAFTPSVLPVVPSGHARIASFNVHGLSGTDPVARFAEVAEAIVTVLGGPDLVALQELGDDDGKTNVGVVSAAATLAQLTDAIRARSGLAYEAVALDPVDGRDGGAPGLNMRPALLIRRDGRFSLVRRAGENATTPSPLRIVDGTAHLLASPMRLGVTDPAFEGGRKPLVAELEFDGEPVFVVVVHLRSQLGDPSLEGRLQPPSRPSDAVRLAEVESIVAFAAELRRANDAPLIVLGDFNEPSERPASIRLFGAGLVDTAAGTSMRSTFIHDGLGASLDRVLVSQSLASGVHDGQVLQRFASRSLAASDHDPVVATIAPPAARRHRAASCDLDLVPSAEGPLTLAVYVTFLGALGARRRRAG